MSEYTAVQGSGPDPSSCACCPVPTGLFCWVHTLLQRLPALLCRADLLACPPSTLHPAHLQCCCSLLGGKLWDVEQCTAVHSNVQLHFLPHQGSVVTGQHLPCWLGCLHPSLPALILTHLCAFSGPRSLFSLVTVAVCVWPVRSAWLVRQRVGSTCECGAWEVLGGGPTSAAAGE